MTRERVGRVHKPVWTGKPLRKHEQAKEDAKARFIALVQDGVPIRYALAQVERSVAAYTAWRRESPEFVDQVNEAKLAAVGKRKPSADFVDFRDLYFPKETKPTTPRHHLLIIEAIERAEPDTLTAILAFPEAAKTSLIVDYANYLLGAVDPNYRIAVISEGQALARKIIGQVQSRMTDESQFGGYIRAFGPFKADERSSTKPWNAEYFTVRKARNDEKEPSMEARGAGSTIYGGRYDLILGDDLQSTRNINMTPQLLEYLRQDVLTRPSKGKGKTVLVGSRVGEGDIYQKLDSEEMLDNLIIIPALDRHISRDEHFTVKNGKVLVNPECEAQSMWPEYWSLLDLAKRRKQVGEEVWARTYMQEKVVAAAQTFSDEAIEVCKDRQRSFGPHAFGTENILSVDPNIESGICAFLAAGCSPQQFRIHDAREYYNVQSGEDIIAEIAAWAATYRPSRVVIEQNGFQKSLARDTRLSEVADKFHFTVVPHETQRNKADPVLGVAMMSAAFADQSISIPWGDPETISRMGPLVDELRSWRPRKRGTQLRQDLVMALWFAWLLWERERQTYEMDNIRLIRPKWLVA